MIRTFPLGLSLLAVFALIPITAAPLFGAAGDLVWYFQGVEDVYAIDDIEDVDGDGTPDIVVESYDAGAVGDHLYCLSGASPGPAAAVIWSTKPAGGASSGGGYGNECMVVGPDMTGDGHEDVLLGTAWGGRSAYVLNGLDASVHYRFDTYYDSPPYPATSGWVYTIKPVPDVDDDFVPDLFFACGSDNDGAYCASPGDGILLWYQFMGDAVFSCAVLDDVNGDGKADGAFGVGDNADAVWVVAGGGGPTATVVWTRPMPGSVLTVERIADISGDGINDVVAGTWTANGDVYALDGTDGRVLWIGPIGSYAYTQRLAALDDVNGDGYEDVAVGNWDNKAVVLSGIDGTILWETRVGTLNGGDVWAIGRVADANGDGINDVAAGSFDYHVYLFDGATGDSLWWYNTGRRLYFVDGVGDITGNGWPDVVAGTQMLTGGPPGGRAYLLEGGDISTGVAGPALVARAVPAGSGVRVLLGGAHGYGSCHVERIVAGEGAGRAAGSFKQELFEAHTKGTMGAADVMAARRLTPGPLWTRLTADPIPILSGEAVFLDPTVEEGAAYEYRFVLLTGSGEEFFSPTARVSLPGDARRAESDLLLAARPNPMNPAATIEFSLPNPGPVRVDIFAASGRHVARVLDAETATGSVLVDWDGRDSNGAFLPSGLYFVRLVTADRTATTKVTVLR
ncbi:MAG: T9SS type A sorting domain-containing protein [Candidatus Eisenbacteria bacterium]